MSVLITRVYSCVADVEDNAAAVVTLAAAAGVRHCLKRVVASYDTAVAAGDRTLTIAWTLFASVVTAEMLVVNNTQTNPGLLDLALEEGEIVGDVGTAITITLAASGVAANRGLLNVWHRNVGNGVI